MNPRRTIGTLVLAITLAVGISIVVPLSSPSSSTADAAVRKNVTSDYTLLRRSPASYVIGTAYRGWTVDVQGPSSRGYSWGRVFGDLSGCLWTFANALSGSAAATPSCSADPQTISTALFTNGQISSGVADGTTVTLVPGAGCATYNGVHITGYGNVRPWQDVTRATSAVPTYLPFGWTVRWRYVTRDGRYVMVRSPLGGPTDGVGVQSWFFLPRGCLPETLP